MMILQGGILRSGIRGCLTLGMAAILSAAWGVAGEVAPPAREHDVVVYGGSSAGIAAAVQVKIAPSL